MTDERWVVLRYVKNETEAHIIKGLLETESIPAIIRQEAIGKAYGLTTDGLGQIRVMVPGHKKREAEELLPPNHDMG